MGRREEARARRMPLTYIRTCSQGLVSALKQLHTLNLCFTKADAPRGLVVACDPRQTPCVLVFPI